MATLTSPSPEAGRAQPRPGSSKGSSRPSSHSRPLTPNRSEHGGLSWRRRASTAHQASTPPQAHQPTTVEPARASSLSVLARALLIPVSSGLTTTTPLHVRLKDPRDLPTAARHLQRHAVRRQQALRQRPETLGRARHPARRQLLGHPRDSQAQLRGLWHSPDLEGALQGREVAAALPAPAFGKLRRQKARSQGAVPSGGDACRSACEGHLTAPLRLSLGANVDTFSAPYDHFARRRAGHAASAYARRQAASRRGFRAVERGITLPAVLHN
jgi:hypothetical protein